MLAAPTGRRGPLADSDLADDELRVTGVVLEASADEVLLDLGDRVAHVILDGHGCRVDVGAAGVARGRRSAEPRRRRWWKRFTMFTW